MTAGGHISPKAVPAELAVFNLGHAYYGYPARDLDKEAASDNEVRYDQPGVGEDTPRVSRTSL